MNMPKTAIKIGPHDHGQRMSLEDFDHAEVQKGYLYELSRGVITVSDVPDLRHFAQVDSIRDQFFDYRLSHRDLIHRIGGGAECKILLADLESERHPDVAIYKTPPPLVTNIWAHWIPEIAIEVVSPGSEYRDYVEKRAEYLAFGVREYWIVDADKEEMLVLRRWGKRWVERVIRPPELYRTRLLPDFAFDCAQVFEAANAAGD
jgi:Uma2 family endonuclease